MNMNTKKITTVGILCAMAMIINLLISFPMVPAASFLRYDPKDIVIIIGGYIYGPMTVVVMSAIVYGTSDTFITFFHCVRLLLFGTHLFCPVFEKTYCYFFLFLLY